MLKGRFLANTTLCELYYCLPLSLLLLLMFSQSLLTFIRDWRGKDFYCFEIKLSIILTSKIRKRRKDCEDCDCHILSKLNKRKAREIEQIKGNNVVFISVPWKSKKDLVEDCNPGRRLSLQTEASFALVAYQPIDTAELDCVKCRHLPGSRFESEVERDYVN